MSAPGRVAVGPPTTSPPRYRIFRRESPAAEWTPIADFAAQEAAMEEGRAFWRRAPTSELEIISTSHGVVVWRSTNEPPPKKDLEVALLKRIAAHSGEDPLGVPIDLLRDLGERHQRSRVLARLQKRSWLRRLDVCGDDVGDGRPTRFVRLTADGRRVAKGRPGSSRPITSQADLMARIQGS